MSNVEYFSVDDQVYQEQWDLREKAFSTPDPNLRYKSERRLTMSPSRKAIMHVFGQNGLKDDTDFFNTEPPLLKF